MPGCMLMVSYEGLGYRAKSGHVNQGSLRAMLRTLRSRRSFGPESGIAAVATLKWACREVNMSIQPHSQHTACSPNAERRAALAKCESSSS